MAKKIILLMLATILCKILGFGRELVLTSTYGASIEADAYIVAVSIPTVLFTSIATTIATTFIPIFYEVDKNEGNAESSKFLNNIFNILLILSIIISIIGFVFSGQLVKIFAMDFSGEKLALAVRFTKIMVICTVFIGLSSLLTSYLQIKDEYTIPGIIGLPYNLLIITGIIISSKSNVEIMAIGTVIGIASQLFFQLPFAIKKGYRYKFYINIKDKYIKRLLILIAPVFLGLCVNQINTIIDRSLASTLGDGVITILNSANRLNGFVLAMFITTIISVIYPKLSNLSNNNSEFKKLVRDSVNYVLLLLVPISVGTIILSNPVTSIVFQRGAFNQVATDMTANALAAYGLGMLGFGIMEILNKVFYSLQDTKIPMLTGIVTMTINIALNIILVRVWGHVGLALATSIAAYIGMIILFIKLSNKIGDFGQKIIGINLIKSIIASIIMGIITVISYNHFIKFSEESTIRSVIVLISSIMIGIISYVILLKCLKVKEINNIIDSIKNRFIRNVNISKKNYSKNNVS